MKLRLERLSFAYEDEVAVFDGVDFTFGPQPVTWVRGGVGGGRSTLLKLFAGLAKPTAGRLWMDDSDVGALDFDRCLDVRLRTGYGFDLGGLLSTFTLAENLALPLNYHRRLDPDVAAARVTELLRRFGLAGQAHLRPFALTGSQRKLGCVLRAFVHEPELILLDEPLAGLKTESVAELTRLVKEALAAGTLRRLLVTGENPLLAVALDADVLRVGRTHFEMETR